MNKFRVIIAGGRQFCDYKKLSEEMDCFLSEITQEIVILCCGEACGADMLGEKYAFEHGYAIDYFPAQRKLYGKMADQVRNELMADHADALVAFWDGCSRGTANMIRIAEQKELGVKVVKYGTDL